MNILVHLFMLQILHSQQLRLKLNITLGQEQIGNLVTNIKGVYSFVFNPRGSVNERTPIPFRNINGDLIPYTVESDKNSWDRRRHGFDDTYIIAVGKKGYSPRPMLIF